MWYFILAVALHVFVYTVSYGIFEWKKGNGQASVAVWVLSLMTLVIPVIKAICQ